MKKLQPTLTFTVLILSVSLIFSSCKKITKTTTFNLSYTKDVTIPSTTSINLPFNLITPDIQTESSSSFEGNNTRADLVDKIQLQSLVLSINSPTGGNFNFLKAVTIRLSASGLADTTIASKNNLQNTGTNSLSLDVSSVNLKDYLVKDKITLTLNSTTDELLTADYSIKVQSVFKVEARLIK